MSIFKHNGAEIHYDEAGSGTPLFLIHGLGANQSMFAPQKDYFQQQYRVICPDLRGNGQSSRLKGPVKTILDRQADDVAALMASLGIEKACFAGVSYGGVFCFHFALRHPEKLAGLVITDSFSDVKPRTFVDWLNMAALYLNLWMFYLPKKVLAAMLSSAYKKWPLAQENIYQSGLVLRSHETVLQRLAINAANHTPDLGKIKVPVLGIVGDDVNLLVQAMERAMAPISGARLVKIKNAMDPSNLCQPDQYNQIVNEFLTEIDS